MRPATVAAPTMTSADYHADRLVLYGPGTAVPGTQSRCLQEDVLAVVREEVPTRPVSSDRGQGDFHAARKVNLSSSRRK